MTVDIVVPQVGEAVAEVTIVRWLKNEGDRIEKGEVVFEVDTDKSVIEVEAFQSGVLLEILAHEGESVLPQDVVAKLEVAGDGGAESKRSGASAGESAAGSEAHRDRSPSHSSVHSNSERTARRKVRATPKARAMATASNVNLEEVPGTGVDGLITAEDVEQARKRGGNHSEVRGPAQNSRRAVAEAMVRSKREVPHFYLQSDVDMSDAAALRDHCVKHLGWHKAPSYTDIIVRAAAAALRQLPTLNVRYSDGSVVSRPTVDIGVAVAGNEGLRVGVLRDADNKSLEEISRGVSDLVQRAREGRLRSGEVGDKSLVVSNLGMYGVDVFYAIIDMPDPLIVAVGKIGDKVVAVDGKPLVRPMCTVSLSADHRALDGADAAQFLAAVKENLEHAMTTVGG